MSTPTGTETRAMTRARSLATHSRLGIVVYVVLAVLVVSGSWGQRLGMPGHVMVFGVALLGVLRTVISLLFDRWYARSPRTWNAAFRVGAVSAALMWSVPASLVIAQRLDDTTLILLVVTAGIAAGATASLSADPPLLVVVLAALLVPDVAAFAIADGHGSLIVGIVIALFFGYLVVLGMRQARALREGLDRSSLLELRARDLEVARHEAVVAREVADEANRAKSAFLANMSHEIRTPLTAVLGYAELLLDPDVSKGDRLAHATTIHRSGKHLLRLLNEILDLSKVEAGAMTVFSEPTELAELLGELSSLMRVRASSKNIGFAVVLDSPIPKTVRTDGVRVRQILDNLVANAIKFTDSGRVRVRVRLEADDALVVDIVDSGIGMAPAQLDKLFAPFVQVDESDERRFAGTGLGLDLSRKLARLLGGDVTVKSELGVGSTFTLRLPMVIESTVRVSSIIARRDAAVDIGSVSLAGLNILVADDMEANRQLIHALLKRCDATVELACDGLEAVEKIQRMRFDVVIMDVQMPRMDGLTAVREVRSEGHTMPIIAVTARAMAEDRAECIAAGCNEWLTKPIEREALILTIRRLCGSKVEEAKPGVPSLAPRARSTQASVLIKEGPIVSSLADDPVVASVLPTFYDEVRDNVAKLRTADGADDVAEIRRIAHSLAGAGGSFGFDVLTATARGVERAAAAALRSSDVGPELRLLNDVCVRIAAGRSDVNRTV